MAIAKRPLAEGEILEDGRFAALNTNEPKKVKVTEVKVKEVKPEVKEVKEAKPEISKTKKADSDE